MKWKLENNRIVGRGIKSDHVEETVDPEDFKQRIRDRDDIENTALRKSFDSEVKAVDKEDKRIIEFTISTARRDRDGDVIDPKGWNLSDYEKNPVVLWGHNPSIPPIGRATDVWMDNDKLKANAEFADVDVDPSGFSDTIYRMLKAGYLNATSVGFLPRELEFIKEEDDDGDMYITGLKFTKQDLLEFSVVGVPSNADALLSDKNINVKPYKDFLEQALDEYSVYKDTLLVPKDTAADVYNKIKNSQNSKGSAMTDETTIDDEHIEPNASKDTEVTETTVEDQTSKSEEFSEKEQSVGASENEENVNESEEHSVKNVDSLLEQIKGLIQEKSNESEGNPEQVQEKDYEYETEKSDEVDKHSFTVTVGDMSIKAESTNQEFLKELFQMQMNTTNNTDGNTTGTEEKEHEQEEVENDDEDETVKNSETEDDEVDLDEIKELLPGLIKDVINDEIKTIKGKV